MKKIFAAFLCFCMLLTLPGISDTVQAAAAEQEESGLENTEQENSGESDDIEDDTLAEGVSLPEIAAFESAQVMAAAGGHTDHTGWTKMSGSTLAR